MPARFTAYDATGPWVVFEESFGRLTSSSENPAHRTGGSMNTEELRHRLKALEAVEEIKKLKARYCQCADERDPEGFANLFADDGDRKSVV